MRVVHTESARGLGGQTLRLIEEARHFSRVMGHECVLVGPAGSPFESRARDQVPFVPFRYARWTDSPSNFLAARRLLGELSPDVVHTHSSTDAWVFGLAARSLGIPVVRGRHVVKTLPRSFGGRLVYTRLADAFTVSGPSAGRTLLDAGVARQEDLFMTPGGVDLERFDPARRDRHGLARELGLEGCTLIGTACALRSWKGVDTLLSALPLVRARMGERVHLIHAGSGDPVLFEHLIRPVADRVHFLGFRDDVERVIGGLDVFVLASKRLEGIPQVVSQAMTLGVPVVATRAGGTADVVRQGETGWLVQPDDPEALAQAVCDVLAMPPAALESILDAARDHVRELCGQERVCAQILAAYERALARRGGRAWRS
jgi:glycosyltransferase involved in cell wall biosynthesis